MISEELLFVRSFVDTRRKIVALGRNERERERGEKFKEEKLQVARPTTTTTTNVQCAIIDEGAEVCVFLGVLVS